VQAGVARTGKWWGHQHVSGEHVEPDIMIFAKGIASGFPFAGEISEAQAFFDRPIHEEPYCHIGDLTLWQCLALQGNVGSQGVLLIAGCVCIGLLSHLRVVITVWNVARFLSTHSWRKNNFQVFQG